MKQISTNPGFKIWARQFSDCVTFHSFCQFILIERKPEGRKREQKWKKCKLNITFPSSFSFSLDIYATSCRFCLRAIRV